MNSSPTLFLIAGEPSGDILGASLIEGLKRRGRGLNFQGIGGPLMERAGSFQSLVPFTDLSVMGLDILWRLPQLYRHLQTTIKHLRHTPPQILLTLDAPEFTLRVARAIKETETRKIHCVAPSVWAWRPGRARKIARHLDHLLTLFPFEPPFFEKEGLASTFIGHPLAEKPLGDPSFFWKRYPALEREKPLLVLLPGSRRGEVERLLPTFLKTAALLQQKIPTLQLALPTLPHLLPFVTKVLEGHPLISCVLTHEASIQSSLFAAGTAALAASGTVTLELALAKLPHVVAYHVPPLLAWGLTFLLKTPFVSLPNIIAHETIVPECLQKNCNPEFLTHHILPLLTSQKAWNLQLEAFENMGSLLKTPISFGDQGAEVIEKYL